MGKYCGRWNLALLSVGTALFLSSCTNVDNTLGDTLIPNHQQMKVARMTILDGIEAYQVRVDSLLVGGRTNSVGGIGRMTSSALGVTESGWMSQYVPSQFSNEDYTFGENPICDSISLYLTFSKHLSYGDTDRAQQFNIYRVTKRFQWNGFYYCYADPDVTQGKIDAMIEPEPISTFEYNGEDAISHRMKGPKAEALMQLLLEHTEENLNNDSLFIDNFHGLYITPAATSPNDASTLMIDIAASNLLFYTHPTAYPDSMIMATYTPNITLESKYFAGFNMYKHDYAGTVFESDPFLEGKIDITGGNGLGYIQGAGGPTVSLRFSDAFVRSLMDKVIYGEKVPATDAERNLAKEADKTQWEYETMAIQGAKLSMKIHKPDIPALDRAFTRLGLYSIYENILSTPDYRYEDELDATNPIELPFGGYLSRTRACYDMDISRIVQLIVTHEGKEDYRNVMLAPSYSYDLYGQGEACIDFNDLGVEVTYTLLR